MEARFSAPVQSSPGAHLAPCTMCTRSLCPRWGGNLAWGGVYHPLPSRAEVKERVQLYFYSPYGSS